MRNTELMDTIHTSTSSENRKQPLAIYITTADYDRPSICNEMYDYACKIRDGVIADPAFLPIIYEATKDDDWKARKTWRKANPNLGVSVSEDYLARFCERAQAVPRLENVFKRLHLNMRTEQECRWISMDLWDACDPGEDPLEWRARKLEEHRHDRAFTSLDLGSVSDLTALALLFPTGDREDEYDLLPFFWIPAETAHKREHDDRVPYATWMQQGYMIRTEGNSTDFAQVERDISEGLANDFGIPEIYIDRAFQGDQMMTNLITAGFVVVPFGQGWVSMAAPMKRFEWVVRTARIHHGNNPILRWMASNMAIEAPNEEQLKPSKKHSGDKIDGIVAGIMALAQAMAKKTGGPSVYETRDPIVITG